MPAKGRRAWFLEIAFIREVGMRVCVCVCVSAPKAINNIHVILNLYNQLNKFVAFRNIMKLSMHGAIKVVSFTEKVILTAVHE